MTRGAMACGTWREVELTLEPIYHHSTYFGGGVGAGISVLVFEAHYSRHTKENVAVRFDSRPAIPVESWESPLGSMANGLFSFGILHRNVDLESLGANGVDHRRSRPHQLRLRQSWVSWDLDGV